MDISAIAFPQGAELLIILAVVLLLFGAKRLPDAARGLGRSMRILKSETKGLHEEDSDSGEPKAVTAENAAEVDLSADRTAAKKEA